MNRKAEKEWSERREKTGGSAQELMEERVREPCSEKVGAIRGDGKIRRQGPFS